MIDVACRTENQVSGHRPILGNPPADSTPPGHQRDVGAGSVALGKEVSSMAALRISASLSRANRFPEDIFGRSGPPVQPLSEAAHAIAQKAVAEGQKVDQDLKYDMGSEIIVSWTASLFFL